MSESERLERPYEQHNRMVPEIVARLLREIPDITKRLVLLESIIVGVIETLPLLPGGNKVVLRLLNEEVSKRLNNTEEGA